MTTNKKVAIIGLGNIGSAIANNLSKSSRSFIVAGRDHQRTTEVTTQWGLAVEVADSISDAIERAEIIILAIPYGEITPLIQQYGNILAGKIIIDPSNPIAPNENGELAKIIPADQSAGECIASKLPEGIRLVKGFGTLGAQSLSAEAFASPRKTLLYASNCPSVQAEIDSLIESAGFAPLYIGDLSQSIRLEVFGALHEFGALGKAVSLDEARVAVNA